MQPAEEDRTQSPAEVVGEGSAQDGSYKTHVTDTNSPEYNIVPEQFPSQLSEDVQQNASQAASPRMFGQLLPTIAKRFTRPISSHVDPADNFAFGKAAPPQNLNFGRKTNRHPSLSDSLGAPSRPEKTSDTFVSYGNLDGMGRNVVMSGTSHVSAKGALIDDIELHGSPQLQSNQLASNQNKTLSPQARNAGNDDTRVPKPTIEEAPRNTNPEDLVEAQTGGLTHSLPQPKLTNQEIPTKVVHTQGVAHTSVSGNLSPQIGSLSPCMRPEKPDYAHTLQQIVQPSGLRGLPRSPSKRVLSPSRRNSVQRDVDGNDMIRRGGFTHTPTRATKPRMKSKLGLIAGAADANVHPAEFQASPSDEDLIRILHFRYKHQQELRHTERARYQKKVAEVKGLREAADTLYHRLQETRERENIQKNEILKYRTIMPKWEAKLRKLTDSVDSMQSDHQNLRVDAQSIQEQQQDISASKCDIEESLLDVRHLARQGNAEAKRLLREARHRMDILEQRIENQETQLQNGSDLVDVERERSRRLEQEIEKITDSHLQLNQLYTEEHKNLAKNIGEILSKSMRMEVGASSDAQNQIKATLDQCVALLQNLDDADTIRPQDLQELSTTMTFYAKKMSRSLQTCVGKLTASETEQKAFVTQFEEQLLGLGKSIGNEHDNATQLINLQELKATIKERLRMTEAALADARRDAITHSAREQMLQQKIMTLEVEAAAIRNTPAESPQANKRMEELDSRNSELQAAMETSRLEILKVSEDLQQNIMVLQTSANEAQMQRDNAVAEIAILSEEKSKRATEAELRLEETRKQLAKAADIEQARLTGQHVNSVRQLRQQLEALQAREAELKPLQEEKEYIQAKAEQDSRQHADEMRRIVQENKTIRAKSDDYINQVEGLQLEIGASEIRIKEQDKELNDLKQQMEAEDAKSDAKIKKLEQEKEQLLSEIKSSSLPVRQPEVRAAVQTPSRDRADLAKSEIERGRQGQKLVEVEDQLRVMTDRLHSSDAQIQILQEEAKAREKVGIAETAANHTPDKPRRKANRNARPNSEPHVHENVPTNHETSELSPEEVSLLASAPRRTESRNGNVHQVLPLSHFPHYIPQRSTTPIPDWEGLFPPTPSQFGGESQELTTYETQSSRMTSSFQGFNARETQELTSVSSQKKIVPRSRDDNGESRELATLGSQEMPSLRDGVQDKRDSAKEKFTLPHQTASRSNDSPRPRVSKDQIVSSSIGIVPCSQKKIVFSNFGAGSAWQPKSILKPSKRDATTAGLLPAETRNGVAKVSKGDKGLGPVIADSQTPSQQVPRNHRQSRMLRKSTKDYQMIRRFSQEFK